MVKKFFCFVILLVSLNACVPGSPLHTSSLSASKLSQVDAYTLCKAATPRELYSPNARVMNEVARRGLNCASIYRYGGANLGNSFQTPSAVRANSLTCFKDGEQSSGFNKICYYKCLGDTVAINQSSTSLCPLTIQR